MIVATILPIFALIVLGFALSRRGFPDAGFWPGAERINYLILFPALLVVSLHDAPVRDPALLRLGGATLLLICGVSAAMAVCQALRPVDRGRFAAALQGITRFNTYLVLAISASLPDPDALGRAVVVLAVGVPLVNLLAIMALSGARRPGALLKSVAGNPPILACAIGIALALAGAGLPDAVLRLLDLLAQASLPLGLLCVGAALQPATARRQAGALAAIGALRLLGMPALAAAIAALLSLGPTETVVLVIFAAVPPATTSYIMTRALGGDAPFMAGLLTTQTLAAAATIPLTLWWLGVG